MSVQSPGVRVRLTLTSVRNLSIARRSTLEYGSTETLSMDQRKRLSMDQRSFRVRLLVRSGRFVIKKFLFFGGNHL